LLIEGSNSVRIYIEVGIIKNLTILIVFSARLAATAKASIAA
jgi:hypothetical protein